MNILLIGSTGLIGSQFVENFPKFFPQGKLFCLLRKVVSSSNNYANFIEHDFNEKRQLESLPWDQINAIVCTLGTTIAVAGSKENFKKVDYQYPLEFAQAAKAHNIPIFSIVTAMGSDSNSKIFYNQVKGQLEEELSALEIPILNIFQPSLLIGDRKEIRTGEIIGKWVSNLVPFSFLGLEKYRPIEGKTVALGILTNLKENQTLLANTQYKSMQPRVHIFESDAISTLLAQKD